MRMRSSGLLSQNCSMVLFHYGENLEIGDEGTMKCSGFSQKWKMAEEGKYST